jgi:hypothetical protein
MLGFAGIILVVFGSKLAITQGSQYFWSQQQGLYHSQHIGSADWAAFGIGLIVVGCILLIRGLQEASSR